jgi:hypothetical protein
MRYQDACSGSTVLKKKKGMIQRLSWSLCKEIFVSFNAFNENA